MRTKQAIEFFGSPTALARALNIKGPSIYSWGKTVPRLRQLQLERITAGRLRADAGILPPVSK